MELLVSIENYEASGIPYIFIPFISCTLFIFLYYIYYRNSLTYQISHSSRTKSHDLTQHNLNKNLTFKLFVTNFIIVLLFLELFISLLRTILAFIPNPKVLEVYNLSENCQIYDFPSLAALNYPFYWLWHLPLALMMSSQLSLLPTIYLLLAVLRERFLDFSYKKLLKRGLCMIIIRYIICVGFISIFATHILFYIIYVIIYLIDFLLYLYYARALYLVILQRRNEARIHKSFDKNLYKERSLVLVQYRITKVYSICVVSLRLFIDILNKISLFILFLVINSCYFNFVTLGYIAMFHFSSQVQIRVMEAFIIANSVIMFLLSLNQLLMFVAYFMITVAIVVKRISFSRKLNRISKAIAPIVQDYHKDFLAYNTN